MKFTIQRTSQLYPPCVGASPAVVTLPNGFNYDVWYREFETLEELVEFARFHGDIILTVPDSEQPGSGYQPGFDGSIEIYDDHRE